MRCFTLFRMFFSARFYYPVYTLLFLDFGLSLEQFGILNAIWAVTIVLCEVPSGALADTIGRRKLLIAAGLCMVVEMGVLLIAPINGGPLLFGLFAVNRVVSGLAEAAASGADEALTYDSLKYAGLEDRWGLVLERVQRDTSLAFFFAMTLGAAVYDPDMVNAVLRLFDPEITLVQSQLVKLPVLMTFISGLVVLQTAVRMKEAPLEAGMTVPETLARSWRQTVSAGKWIWATAFPFGILLAIMAVDNVIRQFLTLDSKYWHVIELPIVSYGLIGSGMAFIGIFVPRLARWMADRFRPVQAFLMTCGLLLLGLVGVSRVLPYWGVLPASLLFICMGVANYLVSRYLNEAAPSEQRATVLSFKGLSTNFAYGTVCLLYSALIAAIKLETDVTAFGSAGAYQDEVFVRSLAWAPWYFLVTVGLVFIVRWLRFARSESGARG
nr:MFS transporter [Coraliomargarita parva]